MLPVVAPDGQEELARCANVSVVTVHRLEAPEGASKVAPSTFEEVQRALEQAGAEFLDEGVRRRKRSPEEIEARVQVGLAIAAECAERLMDTPAFTEDDLYDENGLPA